MEELILEAEERYDALAKQIDDPALAADQIKLEPIWQELESARNRVDRLYERWSELETKRG
jgi:ATP-binding cassette subfamily F protein uup